MRSLNFQLMNALNIAMAPQSAIVWSPNLFRVSVQCVFTGSSPDGSIQLQGSNDCTTSNPNSFTPTNWSNIGSSVSVSGTGIYLIPEQEICYEYVWLIYTQVSGTGTITARLKALGA